MRRAKRSGAERGGIVVGWLVKLVLSLLVVAAVAYEGGAIVFAHIASDSAATDVSDEAALEYSHSHDAPRAEAAARTKAKEEGATLLAFSVDPVSKTVTVTVEKAAHTIVLQRMSFTRSWTLARTTRREAIPA